MDTLKQLNLLSYWKGQHFIAAPAKVVEDYWKMYNAPGGAGVNTGRGMLDGVCRVADARVTLSVTGDATMRQPVAEWPDVCWMPQVASGWRLTSSVCTGSRSHQAQHAPPTSEACVGADVMCSAGSLSVHRSVCGCRQQPHAGPHACVGLYLSGRCLLDVGECVCCCCLLRRWRRQQAQ